MSYRIELTRRAEKELAALADDEFGRIAGVIDNLAKNPRPAGVRKLRGRAVDWRVRVGNRRVIYSIDDEALLVTVIRVTDRKDVYRRLK